jgi:hypothetical protein
MASEKKEFNDSGDIDATHHPLGTRISVAKSKAGRHTILKERLTTQGPAHGSSGASISETMRNCSRTWHIREVIRTFATMARA